MTRSERTAALAALERDRIAAEAAVMAQARKQREAVAHLEEIEKAQEVLRRSDYEPDTAS